VGYSPTGEIFNLSTEDVATATAIHLQADKLVYLVDGPGLPDADGKLMRELSPSEAEQVLKTRELPRPIARCVGSAVNACRKGLRRAHLIDRNVGGSLLLELFTRDGIGTLITSEAYAGTRQATIADVGGILELIRPLEEEGVLVRRSRELLEQEIEHFVVSERDGTIIACSALYPYAAEQLGEVACVAVHPDYRKQKRGDELLRYMERQARGLGIRRLFVLTTRTAHWFQERGFVAGEITDLPVEKQAMYNYQRRSKVFIKALA
jgi:amino-acid N-acetyltransferase